MNKHEVGAYGGVGSASSMSSASLKSDVVLAEAIDMYDEPCGDEEATQEAACKDEHAAQARASLSRAHPHAHAHPCRAHPILCRPASRRRAHLEWCAHDNGVRMTIVRTLRRASRPTPR